MRICTIGGTHFSGRAFVGQALDAGHEVTVFHRGKGEDAWPAAEHVHGDRDGGLGALAGRSFDAVVDFCAYVPRQIDEAISALPDVGRYVFISSVSAHAEDARAGATEDEDVHQPPFPDTEEITWQTYGPLKVASERALAAARGDAATIVRPHYIVGPYDPTDRFTYWVRRGATGGRVLAPGPPEQPLQWIDARDLAAFLLHVCEADVAGTFNIATPPRRHSFAELLDTSAGAGGATLDVAWCDEAFVRAHHLTATEESDPFPLITPEEPNAHLFDTSRAVAHGLTFRSLAETVRDTLAWDRERGEPELQAGLDRGRETELLAEWDASR
jgi:nucleoside-diphosphate-sugar epimerase